MRGVTSHLTVRGRIKACEEWFNPDLKFHCKGGLILDRPKWDRYYADNEHCSQIVIVFAGDNDSCEHKTMRLKNPATILFEKVKQRIKHIKRVCPTVTAVYWGVLSPRRGDVFHDYNRGRHLQ